MLRAKRLLFFVSVVGFELSLLSHWSTFSNAASVVPQVSRRYLADSYDPIEPTRLGEDKRRLRFVRRSSEISESPQDSREPVFSPGQISENEGYDSPISRDIRDPRLRFFKNPDNAMERDEREPRLRLYKKEPRLRFVKKEPRLRFVKKEPRLRFVKKDFDADYYDGLLERENRNPRLRFAKREPRLRFLKREPRLRFVKKNFDADDYKDLLERDGRDPRLRFAKREPRLRFVKKEPRLRFVRKDFETDGYNLLDSEKRDPRLRFAKKEPRLRFVKKEPGLNVQKREAVAPNSGGHSGNSAKSLKQLENDDLGSPEFIDISGEPKIRSRKRRSIGHADNVSRAKRTLSLENNLGPIRSRLERLRTRLERIQRQNLIDALLKAGKKRSLTTFRDQDLRQLQSFRDLLNLVKADEKRSVEAFSDDALGSQEILDINFLKKLLV